MSTQDWGIFAPMEQCRHGKERDSGFKSRRFPVVSSLRAEGDCRLEIHGETGAFYTERYWPEGGRSRMIPDALTPRDFILDGSPPSATHWWKAAVVTRLAIDGIGFQIDYSDGRAERARWDDPELRFTLIDMSEPVASGDTMRLSSRAVRLPHTFSWGWGGWNPGKQWVPGPERYSPPIFLTIEAFRALDAAAQAVGAARFEETSPTRVPPGTRIYHFGPMKAPPPAGRVGEK